MSLKRRLESAGSGPRRRRRLRDQQLRGVERVGQVEPVVVGLRVVVGLVVGREESRSIRRGRSRNEDMGFFFVSLPGLSAFRA